MSKRIFLTSVLIGVSFFIGVQFSLAADASGAALTPSAQPSITVLSPTSGPSNASVAIYGANFTSTGNQINFFCPALSSGGGEASISSADGKSLVTRVTTLAVQAGTTVSYPLNCTVSITNVNGTSNLVSFTITSPSAQPSVTILSPNGGETYKNDGSSITVNWQTNNVPASHAIDLIRLRAQANGREYNLAYSVLNDGQEIITIPSSVPVGAYTLEIKTYVGGNLAMDSSDSYFKIVDVSQNQSSVTVPTPTVPAATTPKPVEAPQSQSSVTVLSPNGGENLQSGSFYKIKWTANNLPPDAFVNVWLLDNPTRLGSMILAKVPNTGLTGWTASPLNVLTDQKTFQPVAPSGNYVIFIECADHNCTVDSSNAPFTIAVSSTEVREQMKCVFKGAASEQKCYAATDGSSPYAGYSCSGAESCVVDTKGINGDKITWKSSCGGYAYSVMDGSSEYAIFDCPTPVITAPTTSTTISPTATAAKEKAEQILDINEKSKLLSYNNFDFILAELNQLRSIIKEQQTEIKYLKSLVMDVKDLSEKSQDAINNFITYGVDANTEKLGAGERAAVMYSYKAAFDKLPETEAELADAIKIANGRFPLVTSQDAEKAAKEQFVKIYKRTPDLNDANDNAAIKVMAYGLRQKAENRNLNSEKAGIKIFKNIFGAVPKTTEDWNTMQAITYSGATR